MKYQQGIGMVFIVFLLAVIAFGVFYKDKDGVTYMAKAQSFVEKMRADTIGKAEEAKKQMEARDAKLQRDMKELE